MSEIFPFGALLAALDDARLSAPDAGAPTSNISWHRLATPKPAHMILQSE